MSTVWGSRQRDRTFAHRPETGATEMTDDLIDRVARAIEKNKKSIPDWRFLARAAIEAMPGWQPIKSAPRDGTKIDLWITPPPGALTTGRYSRVADCWYADGRWWFCNESQYASDPANCRSEVWHVTHWMPLPDPPN